MRRARTLWLCLLPLLLFAAGAAKAGAAGERDVAIVSFDPMSDRLSATQRCTLDVIYDGTLVSAGLRGYHLEITFDNTYVYADSLDVHVTEGSFLSDVGGTAFYVLPVDENTFLVDCAILGATAGASGVGDLCSITFKGRTGDGTSVVEFLDVKLRDPENRWIMYSAGFAVLILDNTPPSVPVLDPEPEFTPGTTNDLSWSDESPTGAVGYCVQASETPTFDVIVSTSGCTPYTYHTFLGLTDGQIYYYRVQCRDDLWNVSDWSDTEYSTQDDRPPDTEAGPIDPYYNTISFDVPFTASDATSGVQYVELYYQRDGGGYVQYGSTFTVSPIAFVAPGEGVYEFYTIGTDNVDNVEATPTTADCTTEVDLTSGLELGGEEEVPLRLRLGQNVPNPFNPRTAIAFDVPERCGVTLRVYGVDGCEVATLVDEPRDAGAYQILWDGTDDRGTDAASGVYFYVLEVGGLRLTQKMVLMR